ncbi:MAG: CatA-like O-acetyltransferase, family 3 [Tidjanibacter sp.]|nr:CatA-like O-acetyltransferase, family 3 [Tidjanibacter sp.]
MNQSEYKVVDLQRYYRKAVYDRFTKQCKCSVSITNSIDVTALYDFSKASRTKFYINFLYLLSKVLNSREDYRLGYLFQTDQVVLYNQINPTHYIFHDDTETCTHVYSLYYPDYKQFYEACEQDIVRAKQTRELNFDEPRHPNWFDASYISWLCYDSLNIELPDGYLYYTPIINWGKYRKEGDRLTMPVTVRMNHAVADGYLISKVFLLLADAIAEFTAART